MSRFKRINDDDGPEYLINALNGAEPDKYEKLRQGAALRKKAIADNHQQFRKTAAKQPHDWEQAPQPNRYEVLNFPNTEEEFYNNYAATKSDLIRRAGYGIDDPETSKDLKFFSDQDYMSSYMSASIFNPDFKDIQDEFKRSQEMFYAKEQQTLKEAHAERHNEWQRNAMSKTDPKLTNSRLNRIIRNGSDRTHDSAFGLAAYNDLDAREMQKLQIRDNRRHQVAGLKRKGLSPQQHHEAWERAVNPMAQTYEDYYGESTLVDDLFLD